MRSFQRYVPLAAAVVALSLGAGGALAKGPGPRAGAAKAAAAYIGVSVKELRTQLKGGKSLGDVATAHGKSVSGLEAAILAGAKTRLDAAVAAGKLTAEQAAERLEKLQNRVHELVTRTGVAGKGKPGKAKQAVRGAAAATATYTGLTVEQVRAQLKAGTSLAEIATGAGKTVAGLKAAILSDAGARIEKLVSSGKISAERGRRYLDRITSNIDKIVNAKKKAATS